VPLSSRALQYLSIALLAGLGANALLGRWWTDPIAGLAVAAVAFRKGLAGWRGQADACCALLVGAGPAARSVPGRCCG
jgi:divalent metal cation (Fe/Co/Zn/Cd) transporter